MQWYLYMQNNLIILTWQRHPRIIVNDPMSALNVKSFSLIVIVAI